MRPPKKSLGQNFITDNNFLLKMNDYIESSKNNILVEIGPGRGALTKFLSQKDFKHLYLVEKDDYLATCLKQKYKGCKKIKIIHQDALIYNYSNLSSKTGKIIVYGNLPFNISTKLLSVWLRTEIWPSFFDKMILMFQKEVADRIVASHNSKKYGRLSILVQSRCKVSKLFDAPSSIFFPKPKVDGALVQFEPIKDFSKINFKKLENTLQDYKELLLKLKIDENLRPENLSVSDYCNIVKLIR